MSIDSDRQRIRVHCLSSISWSVVSAVYILKTRSSDEGTNHLLNGGGSTPRISLQGKGSGYSYYSLGLSRSFLKEERLSLNIYCSNVLEKYRTYNNHTEGANFISKSSSKYPSRYYGFSISYRLGELKASVKKAARSIDNDDVKGGGGGGNTGGGGGQ